MAGNLTQSPAAPADAEETFELSAEDLASDKDAEAEVEEVEDAHEADAAAVVTADDKKPEPAKVEPEPEPEPEPVAKVKEPESKPEPVKLDPIAREERAKRKQYAQMFAETKTALDEAERTIAFLRAESTETDDPNLKKFHQELLEEASKATDLADIVKITMREMDRRDRARVRQLNQRIYTMQCEVSEAKSAARHPDFYQVIEKAGLFDAISLDAQGRWKDQRVGERIYYNADKTPNADPGERMYRLALGKLEYEREQRGESEPEETPVAKNGTSNGARREAPATKAEVVEAERRGAAKVVEQVTHNSTRLRGIRNLPKAANGPVQITRRQLDEMLDKNPEQYERLIRRRPEVERYHLGG